MGELQLPCLDRPFCLGSLYDCRTDTLLPGPLVWDNTAMEMALQKSEEHSEPTCILDTIVANSQADKMSQLNFSRDLKLNLLSGLSEDVSGPIVSFLEDLPPPNSEARVYLRCQTLSKVEEIATEKIKLDGQQKKIPKQATHVVFKIQHGNDAFFIFDCPDHKVQDVQCTMKDAIEAFNQNISECGVNKSPESSPLPVKLQEYKCKSFYTDRHINPQKTVSNLSDVIETCRDRAVNLTDHNAVPQKVWLCPLNRLAINNDSTSTEVATVEVSEEVVTSIQKVFEDIKELQDKVGDLITEQHDSLSKFSTLHNQVVMFQELLIQFTTNMKKNLCSRLPEVRSGRIKEALLIENLEGTSFDPKCLRKWLNQAKAEIVELTRQILSHLQDPIEFLNDIPHPQSDVQNVICFVCNVTVKDDQLLSAMSSDLQTSEVICGNWLSESWTENEHVVKALGERFQKFTAYSESNKHLKDVKFVLVESNCELSADHATIVLSRPGSKQLFDLPSKPGTPKMNLASTTSDFISLQWTEPESHQSIESYDVLYCAQSSMQNQPRNWQKITTVTGSSNVKISRNCFENKQKHSFKVSPVLYHIGNITCIESDSVVIDIQFAPFQTDHQTAGDNQKNICQPGKPKATHVTHNTVDLQWDKPEYGSELVQTYILSYRLQDATDNDLKYKRHPIQGSQNTASISGLEPEKRYLFKVKPMCRRSDLVQQDSEISEPIETKLTCQPGKPKLVLATHNSIHLQWSKPKYGGESVAFYVVNYRKSHEKESSNEVQYTQGHEEEITFRDLQLDVQYVFTVKPMCKHGSRYAESESEQSEPIKTITTCQTGKPQPAVATHNSITVTWEKPDYGEENVSFYILSYRSVNDSVTHWERKNAGKSTSIKVTDLEVHTKYLFLVKPQCDGTIEGIESEISNEIETKPTCQPGKPIATSVTHDTVTLKWNKPEYHHDSVGLYIIAYQSEHESPDRWLQKSTDDVRENIEIGGLSMGTKYTFKVKPECKDDCHMYSCTIAESETSVIETMVTSKPDKPFVCNIRHNKVDVAWEHPVYGKENIMSYTVMTQLIDDPATEWTLSLTEIKSLHKSATVAGLVSNSKYHFKVIPICQNGHGMESDTSTPVDTSPACQTSKPIVSNITHNSVTLTWEKPNYCSDQINRYHVLCHSLLPEDQQKLATSGVQQKMLETKGAEVHITVDKLTIDTEYFFRIVPECTAPEVIGVESEESERIRTKATSPPENVKLSVIDHNSIKVKWSKPEHKIPNKKISSYCVSYRAVHDPPNEWKAKDDVSSTRECIIQGLTASTLYTFKVCAKYASGLQGTESESTTPVQTKPSCKPGKIQCTDVSHDTIHLQWAKPRDSASNVKHYMVSYCGPDGLWNVATPHGCVECNFIVENLMLNTGYVFRVEPICSSSWFSFTGSIPVEITESNVIFTKATSKPGTPTIKSAVASSITYGSIELEWAMPEYGVHNVKTFTVLYSSTSEVTEEWHKQETYGNQTSMIMNGLALNNSYVFKVCPKCATGEDGMESDISCPIQTKATSPPTNLVFTNITHNSLKVSWRPPECGSEEVTNYTVVYWKIDDQNANIPTNSLTTTRECVTVKELAAKTRYAFKVIPKCRIGVIGTEFQSDQCGPVETKPSCKTGIPIASTVTHESVELQWEKPNFASSSVQYYTISHCPADDQENITSVLDTDGQIETMTIPDLASNTAYVFKICPHCSDSEIGTEDSVSDIIMTKAISQPGKPKASVITHNSVELNWKKPEYGSELVKSYIVSYCMLKDSKALVWTRKETNGQQENITIKGLKLNERYIFKVFPECIRERGEGSESDASDEVVTRAASPPGKPTASNVSSNNIQLKWSPPVYGNDNVSFYTVSYHSIGESDSECKKQESQSAQTSLDITGLKINTKYIFKVKSECKSGLIGSEGDSSDSIATKATSKPGTPHIISTTNDTVHLKWNKPEQCSGNIESYTVLFRQASAESVHWQQCDTKTANTNANVKGLEVKTQYVFKVCPVCSESSGTGSDSDESEPCWTKATSPPGIPEATGVTHDTIQLKWSKPLYGSENVHHYVITCYTEDSISSQSRKVLETDGAKELVTVNELKPRNRYTFTVRCECTGSIKGMESGSCEPIETTITSPPGKPLHVCEELTCNTITLEWTKPNVGNEHVKCYSVYYKIFSDTLQDQWLGPTQTDKNNAAIKVTQLTPQTKYVFKVKAECETAGFGCESECSDVVESKPASKPGKPFAILVTHDTVCLQWEKPKFGSESVEYYAVSFYAKNEPDSKKLINGTKDCSLQVQKLKALTKYIFEVQPQFKTSTADDYSDPSDPVETKATSQPGKPVADFVIHDSVDLKWTEPAFNENVLHYLIQYQQAGSAGQWFPQKTKGSQTRELVSGLTPGKKYVFKLRAVCQMGEGSESESSEVIETKATSLPGTPTAKTVSHNSIQLTWSKPRIGYDKIVSYCVFYQKPEGKSQQWTPKHTDGVQEAITLDHLNLNMQYDFYVQPQCQNNQVGTNSETASITTKATSAPGKPTASLLTHNEIHLKWTKPEKGIENILSYILQFYRFTDKPDKWIDSKLAVEANDELATVTGLNPGTRYVFKLLPQCKSGIGTESEDSELIETRLTSKPGTPEAFDIVHNRLSLRWTKPEYGRNSLAGYIVYTKEANCDKADWKPQDCDVNELDTVVGGLKPGKKYIFKVQPTCKDNGLGAVSDTSDPVETKSTSPPGKPNVSETRDSITHDSISISWTAPTSGADNIAGYTIHYRIRDDLPDDWTTCKVLSATILSQTVSKLQSNTKYIFKVSSTCSTQSGIGAESECSEVIETKPSCKPGKPEAADDDITHEYITLKWNKPEYGKVECYTVHYKKTTSTQWSQETTVANSIKLEKLNHKTEYQIQVYPQIEPGSGIGIESSELITITTKHIPLAERMKAKSHCIERGKSGCPDTYQVPIQTVTKDDVKKIRKCFVGEDNVQQIKFRSGKVIMLVGATGTGKTTLINGLVNHVLGVKWEHSYRFKMIFEALQSDQTKSQTKWITSYTIQEMEESPIKYPLTIIDTPGFGDTEGIERDQRLVEQIRAFFCTKGDGGIDQIHAIGFATQAGLARLTHIQKYIFHSVMAVFGNDVRDIIFMMTNFADGQPAPVLKAVKEAGVPYHRAFKFNNSALFANNSATSAIDKMFWEMGNASFTEFFHVLSKTTPRSLTLTKEVLQEREHLEVCVEGLQQQVRAGLSKIETLRQEEDILNKHEAQLNLNQEFTYKIDVTKQRKVDLSSGKHVTNCLHCHLTCHYPCYIAKDEEKHSCAAMISIHGDARCSACPGKCHWKQHFNNPYRFEIYQEEETKTSEDLKKRYHDAKDGKIKVENMISKLHKDLDAWYEDVLKTIRRTQQSLKRLQEIALKPNPLTEVGYIEQLIQSEKQEADPGYLQRIQSLEKLKEKAKLLAKLPPDKFNPNSSRGAKAWESFLSSDV